MAMATVNGHSIKTNVRFVCMGLGDSKTETK